MGGESWRELDQARIRSLAVCIIVLAVWLSLRGPFGDKRFHAFVFFFPVTSLHRDQSLRSARMLRCQKTWRVLLIIEFSEKDYRILCFDCALDIQITPAVLGNVEPSDTLC